LGARRAVGTAVDWVENWEPRWVDSKAACWVVMKAVQTAALWDEHEAARTAKMTGD
jgi:hypothetical protein